MRARLQTAIATLLMLAPGAARADVELGGYTLSGWAEVGGQAIAGDHESAEFEEYRDVQEWIGRSSFLLQQRDGLRFLRGMFRDVGQDDQRFRLEFGSYGSWELFADYSEVPHRFSNRAETPYNGVRDAGLTLPFTRPPGPGASNLGPAVAAVLQDQDLRFQTRRGELGGSWTPLPGLELSTGYRLIEKQGTIYRGGLSHPFGFVAAPLFAFIAAEFASFATPVDERIHEFTGDAHWNVGAGRFSLNYTGNLYDQRAGESLTIDNPLIGLDSATASSRWRQSLSPDNSAHTLSLAGAIPLREPFPMRFTGTVAYGVRLQDEDFVPFTVNSFFAADPRLRLQQDDLDGRINTWLGDFRFNARPHERVEFDARYRVYDYDNDSDTLEFDAVIVNDTTLSDDVAGEPQRLTVAPGYTRHDADVETSLRLFEGATLGLGWEWELWRRTRDRAVSRTQEHGPTARFDWQLGRKVQLRSRYTYTWRTNSDYDAFDHFFETHPPTVTLDEAEIALFPELRNYPQADREQHVANVIAQISPCEGLDLSLNGGLDLSHYPRSDYGLTEDEGWFAGIDASAAPFDWLQVGAYYTFDRSRVAQDSRQRPVVGVPEMVVDDPANDWNSRTTEHAHNVGANVWIDLIPGRLETELAYGFQKGYVRTHAGGPNLGAVNWPSIRNTLHRAGAALTFHVNERLSVQAHYRYDKYSQRDFQFDDIRPFEPALTALSLFLGNEVDDYQAHIYGGTIRFEF